LLYFMMDGCLGLDALRHAFLFIVATHGRVASLR
jgi:hypothetical protein